MKWIKNNAPVIMMGYSLIFSMIEWGLIENEYTQIYPYLSQGLGFSLFTNLVFLAFYFNKYFCSVIKLCVVGLFVMNIISLICIAFNANTYIYDFSISLICLLIFLIYKMRINVFNRVTNRDN